MEPFELYLLVVVLSHVLLVLGHSLRGLVSNFVQTIQVQLQFVIVVVFVEEFLPKASEPYLDGDDYFCAIC